MSTVEAALAKIPFLSGLDADCRKQVADQVDLRDYPEGATIVEQDDPGRTLYIILRGRVRVVRHSRSAETAAPLAEFGPGEFFGEMALLENLPRSADVIATTPTTCALLTWEVFHTCLLGNPDVAQALLATLSRRLRALSELHERPRVDTKAPAKERERRILEQGELSMTSDIRDALVIKEHNHFTIFDPLGNIPPGNTAGLGLYLGDTRHLSAYELSLGRVHAVVLVSTAQLGYAAEQQLTNRDLTTDKVTIRKETILVSRDRVAHDAGFWEEIVVRNFNPFPVQVEVHIQYAADFADLFEVRGIGRTRRGTMRHPVVGEDTVTLGYDGLDGRYYETALTFTPRPARLSGSTMVCRLHVAALGEGGLTVNVAARTTGDGVVEGRDLAQVPDAATQIERAKHSYQEWRAAATQIDSANELFDATIARSLDDLRLLVNRLGDQW
ncbi:MAG TPA: glycogen debranching N-terminal domain-containing protein, partial [Thermomicrobiales bacterium]|nr:glycogen debranching N-terminal domain-containing protein [Thermomicrobiales bacterium]